MHGRTRYIVAIVLALGLLAITLFAIRGRPPEITPPPNVMTGQTDVCPNLDGTQLTMPEGKKMSGGNCINLPPVDNTPKVADPCFQPGQETECVNSWTFGWVQVTWVWLGQHDGAILAGLIVGAVVVALGGNLFIAILGGFSMLLVGLLFGAAFLEWLETVGFYEMAPGAKLPVVGNIFLGLTVGLAIGATLALIATLFGARKEAIALLVLGGLMGMLWQGGGPIVANGTPAVVDWWNTTVHSLTPTAKASYAPMPAPTKVKAVDVVPAESGCEPGSNVPVYVNDGFVPVRPNCWSDWKIDPKSPCPCVYAVGAGGRLIRKEPVCAGHENDADVANIPLAGWKPVNGIALINVNYYSG